MSLATCSYTFHFYGFKSFILLGQTDMFLPILQNVTFWQATKCQFPKNAQKIQEKAKNHQYLKKNVHVW